MQRKRNMRKRKTTRKKAGEKTKGNLHMGELVGRKGKAPINNTLSVVSKEFLGKVFYFTMG